MTEDTTFKALITDMDGVLTRTARVHERAWKTLFDEVLKEHNQTPFTHDDYRQYVDGKPRYDGVRDFLTSRNIAIDEGSPSDTAEHKTVYGLGKRKNDMFLRLIEEDGVETFPDATAAVARWRRGHLPLAAFSASRNCKRILRAAGLIDQFDTIVDGETAQEHNLDGKPDLMLLAAKQLGVHPSETVVLEDATSGVRAGRDSQFGLVVGVNRGDHAEELDDAGAHRVVNSLSELRFKRAMPAALDDYAAIEQIRNERPVAIFLDYDGTLTPIVNDPDAANMDDDMRDVVRELAATYPVAVVSGRARNDVEPRVALEDLYYAGNHGFDIKGPDRSMTHKEAADARPELDNVERQLHDQLDAIDGTFIERKPFSVAIHYRNVDTEHHATVSDSVASIASGVSHLKRHDGKMVIELLPDVEWDKGHAVNWIINALNIDPAQSLVMYIGDDETDEDAFRAIHGHGLGIRVGDREIATLADYVLHDPDEVKSFLRRLKGRV